MERTTRPRGRREAALKCDMSGATIELMIHSVFRQPVTESWRKLFYDGFNHLTVDGERWPLSLEERELIGALSKTVNAPAWLARRLLAGRLRARFSPVARMRDGHALCDVSASTGISEAFEVAEAKLGTYLRYKAGETDLGETLSRPAYEHEMAKADRDPIKHVPYRHDLKAASALVRPFLAPEMYLTAAEYLGVLPVLSSVRIAWSPNDSDGLRSSQMFHLDPEAARQVKVFIAVRDVGPENSPLTFVPEHHTLALIRSGNPAFLGRRVKDRKLAEDVAPSEWISHEGPAGSAVFIDTSRSFHYGSRAAPQPRLLLYAQYLDPFCSVFAAARRPRQKLAKMFSFYDTQDGAELAVLARRLA